MIFVFQAETKAIVPEKTPTALFAGLQSKEHPLGGLMHRNKSTILLCAIGYTFHLVVISLIGWNGTLLFLPEFADAENVLYWFNATQLIAFPVTFFIGALACKSPCSCCDLLFGRGRGSAVCLPFSRRCKKYRIVCFVGGAFDRHGKQHVLSFMAECSRGAR